MSFAIQQTPEVEDSVRAWGLSKPQLDELGFRIHEDLAENPARNLHPVKNEPDYLEYSFESSILVNGNTAIYAFRVVYSQDEESLVILEAHRVTGPAP